jgi:hypothetical protein
MQANTASMVTVEILAAAFSYIENEFRISDGIITAKMWAEGIAFGQRCCVDSRDIAQARAALAQLPAVVWADIMRYSANLRAEVV